MDGCYCSVKKVILLERMNGSRMMADPPEEASTFERINNRPQFLSSNMYTTLKNGQLQKCFEKNILPFKNLMLQIDPYNSNCS